MGRINNRNNNMKNMKSVNLFKSKTMWFGALFVLNGLAQSFGYGDFVPSGELNTYSSYGIGLIVWVLRWVTTKPVSL